MFLLEFLEEKLGTKALWPTYVLRLLFVDAPTVLGITFLAAFFYGNSVPMNAALSLYLTCNASDPALIRHIMTICYDEWWETPDTARLVLYFNMAERQYLFIHGSVLPVLEEFSTTGLTLTSV
jgi:hypothetical protein